MSLDHCEEYVGAASPTGYRKQCARPSTFYATKVAGWDGGSTPIGTVIALCTRHADDYAQPVWRVVKVVRS